MIKGSQLVGRAVIDLESANRLGRIKEIIVQRDGERVAGFIAVVGETIVGTGGTKRVIPASALHSIGPDAITVRGSGIKERPHELDDLPRMSDVIGHKMVTRSGRLLGSIDDMLVDGADGTIIGFTVGEGVRNKLENIFNPQRKVHGYVRADADLQVGNELIVVPDDALIEGEPTAQERDHESPTQKAEQNEARRWGERERNPVESPRSSIWTRGADKPASDESQTTAENHVDSGNATPVENERAAAPVEPAPQAAPAVREDEAVASARQDQAPK